MTKHKLNTVSLLIIFSFFALLFFGCFILNKLSYGFDNVVLKNIFMIVYIPLFLIVCYFSYFSFKYIERIKFLFAVFSIFFLISLNDGTLESICVLFIVFFLIFCLYHFIYFNFYDDCFEVEKLKVIFVIFFTLSTTQYLLKISILSVIFIIIFCTYYLYFFHFKNFNSNEKLKAYDNLIEIFKVFVCINFVKFILLLIIIYNMSSYKGNYKVFYDILNQVNEIFIYLIKPEDSYTWWIIEPTKRNLDNVIMTFKYFLISIFVCSFFLPINDELTKSIKYKYLYYYVKKNINKAVVICLILCSLLSLCLKLIDHSIIYLYGTKDLVKGMYETDKYMMLEVLYVFIEVMVFSKFYYKWEIENVFVNFYRKIYTFLIIIFIILATWAFYNSYVTVFNKYFLLVLYYFFIFTTIFFMIVLSKLFVNNKYKNKFLTKTLIIVQLCIFVVLIYTVHYELLKKYVIFSIFLNSFVLKNEILLMKDFVERKILYIIGNVK